MHEVKRQAEDRSRNARGGEDIIAPEEDIPPTSMNVTDSLGSLGSQSGRLVEDMRSRLPPIGLNLKKERTNNNFPDPASVRKRDEKKKGGAASFRTAGHATLRSHAVSSSSGAPLLEKGRMNQTLQSNTWTKKNPSVDGQPSFTTTWTRKYVSPYTQRNPRNAKRS
jgi:hypothetical protein